MNVVVFFSHKTRINIGGNFASPVNVLISEYSYICSGKQDGNTEQNNVFFPGLLLI